MRHTPAYVHQDSAPMRTFPSPPPYIPAATPDDDAFMTSLIDDGDDIEESPWMSMGDL